MVKVELGYKQTEIVICCFNVATFNIDLDHVFVFLVILITSTSFSPCCTFNIDLDLVFVFLVILTSTSLSPCFLFTQ
jgi:hypothetical protein